MAHAPTFFERFGYLGTCVLPAEVLDNTPLTDPETGLIPPTLRQRCSFQQLCFAHVLRSFAEGLYWAEVSATADLADTERVVLTETHLAYALAWDERLRWREPAQIRRLMQAHARNLKPLRPHRRPEQAETAAQVPLVAQAPIIVSSAELQETLAPASIPPQKPHRPTRSTKQVPLAVQQGLLLTMLRKLQRQMEQAEDVVTAQTLRARCALLKRMQRWQQQTHQRVVNVSPGRCAKRHRPTWSLTLGVPETLLALAAA